MGQPRTGVNLGMQPSLLVTDSSRDCNIFRGNAGAALRRRLGEQLRLRWLLLLPLLGDDVGPNVDYPLEVLDHASYSSLVTGEWYIQGHRLSGFRANPLASMAPNFPQLVRISCPSSSCFDGAAAWMGYRQHPSQRRIGGATCGG
ncbi:hypothetical protein E2562_027326 [Oryza meyeriana var. granulata]|uniref:Uncharacterized protein n=1 Tax=Oryza meyeriana var. granulata TaxID=110450 RepID=A0A6G1C0T5_9ORYZ|nr:hypothetical protein E2562_027326 [Oryza meyeriana var. granulata]